MLVEFANKISTALVTQVAFPFPTDSWNHGIIMQMGLFGEDLMCFPFRSSP